MVRIPIMIFCATNPFSIAIIPKNTKLTPIITDAVPALITGKIMKNNPKTMDNIPAILLDSIFFSSKLCYAHFPSEAFIYNLKATTLLYLLVIFCNI